MSDETTLLPCPFCGGEADEYEGDYGNGIYCMMCGAMVGEPIHMEYKTTKRVNIEEAIAAWNTRTTHGTLTAEQVSKAVYAHSIHADCADADWQAISDELNATVGNGTCEVEYCGELWWRCRSCRERWRQESYKPNFCPSCGGRAVKR